jgi:cytochrome c553
MRRRFGTVARGGLLAGLVLAAALAGCSDEKSGSADANKTPAADPAAGKHVAETQCRPCHAVDGRGTTPGIPNLAGEPQQYLLASLSEYRNGRRLHGALRNIASSLTDAQTRDVTAYFAGLQRQAINGHAPVFSPFEHGKALSPTCVKCHGANGVSTTPGTPNLAGQQPHYFVAALQEYLNGTRETSPMHALIRGLDKLDMDSLALYFGSQTPLQRPKAAVGDAAAGERHTVLCAGCHGLQGVSSDSSTPSLAGQDAVYLVNAIKAYRAKRRNEPMQRAVAALSDKDVDDIAAYYAGLPAHAAEDGPGLVREITQKCDRCHSAAAAGVPAAFPVLFGQDKDYLIMALRAYRDGRRQSSVMHNMSIPYGDAVIESVASFYASRAPAGETGGKQ